MKLFIIMLITFYSGFAQEFTVEKVTGTVKVLKGTSENWESVKVNDKLSQNDVILTEKRSSITISNDEQKFLLKDNTAIGLNHLRKVTINELILALTLDEIRNVPKIKRNGLSKNTAVYGTEISEMDKSYIKNKDLGEKKIMGAIFLSESGFKESSLIAAKEVFRNYPDISSNFNYRIHFVNIFTDLELYQETLSELNRISKLNLTNEEKAILKTKNEEINSKIIKNK